MNQRYNKPNIIIIVAMAENRVIGKSNHLPWDLPADRRHFKTITTGHTVVMGRKTYQSIGKPLPERTNVVVTRNYTFEAPGCIVLPSPEQALYCLGGTKKICVIGGAEIYQYFIPHAQYIYLTLVHHKFPGDVFFPALDDAWRRVSSQQYAADEKNPYDYSFLEFERIKQPLSGSA